MKKVKFNLNQLLLYISEKPRTEQDIVDFCRDNFNLRERKNIRRHIDNLIEMNILNKKYSKYVMTKEAKKYFMEHIEYIKTKFIKEPVPTKVKFEDLKGKEKIRLLYDYHKVLNEGIKQMSELEKENYMLLLLLAMCNRYFKLQHLPDIETLLILLEQTTEFKIPKENKEILKKIFDKIKNIEKEAVKMEGKSNKK